VLRVNKVVYIIRKYFKINFIKTASPLGRLCYMLVPVSSQNMIRCDWNLSIKLFGSLPATASLSHGPNDILLIYCRIL